ncbi:MAG: sorting protein [Patescibacteria group bacterium]|jgi:hypothetical protein|nr:sorting protein [Patescibacteria group bacterium]
MIRRLLASGLLLAVLLLPHIAAAVPLVPSPTLTLGPMTFSGFTCVITASGPGIGGPAACTGIDVSTVSDGIRFNSGFAADLGFVTDVAITYMVTSTIPITAIDLNFDGTSLFGNNSVTNVVESVYAGIGGPLIGKLTVSCSSLGSCDHQDPPLEGGDIQLSAPTFSAYVTKDIQLVAGVTSGAAVSFIDQSIHVPEPASMMVLGVGFAGLGFATRRRWGGGTLGRAANDDSQRKAA